MRNGIIQFLLIFCAVSLLFFPQTSIDGAKNGLLLWSATITPTLLPFLLLSGFMQYYQTFHFLSRLFFPLKKLFPDMMTFSTPVFLVFSVAVHSVQKLSMILFSLVLIPNRKVRHFFMFAIRSAQCLLLDIH